MKTLGIIGGIGPESTIDYYRLIIAAHRERAPEAGYPTMVIDSIDLQRMLDWFAADQLAEVAAYVAAGASRLAAAGAEFALIAANTPHIVFDEIAAQSPIPLLSIVEATRQEARSRGMKRVGLLGTGYTMKGRFYADPFADAGIDVVVPSADEQAFIHGKYLGELIPGTFLPETRAAISAVIQRLAREERIDGVVLAGTELPLLLREVADAGVPFLDTTRLHVDAAVTRLLST